MEESKNVRTQPGSPAPHADRIIELTPAMEIGTRAKIIDLTEVVKSPEDRCTPDAAPSIPGGHCAFIMPQASDATGIEADVGAAFDVIASPGNAQTSQSELFEDHKMALSRIAQPEPASPPATVEPELELTIDDFGNDEAEKATPNAMDIFQDSSAAADPDDLLDLSRILDSDDSAQAQDETIEFYDIEEDEVLELTDIVDPEASAMDDDEPIELTDIVDLETVAVMEDHIAHVDSFDLETVAINRDELIELTDIVGPEGVANEKEDIEDEPIELTDLVDSDTFAIERDDRIELPDIADPTSSHVDEEAISRVIEKVFSKYTMGPANRFSGADDEKAEKQVTGILPAAPIESQIERVVEKILQTKYAQTIEATIAKVVESVVTREIEKLKHNLMEDEN